jgi:hypothetical protein
VANVIVHHNLLGRNGRTVSLIWQAVAGISIKNNILFENADMAWQVSILLEVASLSTRTFHSEILLERRIWEMTGPLPISLSHQETI